MVSSSWDYFPENDHMGTPILPPLGRQKDWLQRRGSSNVSIGESKMAINKRSFAQISTETLLHSLHF